MALSLNGTSGFQFAPKPPPFVPVEPDYGICDRRYGSHLTPLLCGWASETLTQGNSPIQYTVGGHARGPQVLPHTAVFGEFVSVFGNLWIFLTLCALCGRKLQDMDRDSRSHNPRDL